MMEIAVGVVMLLILAMMIPLLGILIWAIYNDVRGGR